MLTSSAVMSITNDLALSPHDRRSASQPPRRESATSNATRTRPHTVSAETRHSYAQRHADAGTPVDVLRELMGHRSTRHYPAATTASAKTVRRDAVDTLTAHAVRPALATASGGKPQALLDSRTRPPRRRPGRGPLRHLRRALQRPSRRRRLPVSVPVRWAATTSAPTSPTCPSCTPTSTTCCATANACLPPPISTTGHGSRPCPRTPRSRGIRRLIHRVEHDLDALDDTDQRQIEEAVAIVRRTRQTVQLGMPSTSRQHSIRPGENHVTTLPSDPMIAARRTTSTPTPPGPRRAR